MNKYIFFLLLLVFPLAFISCSDDDDDNETENWKVKNETYFDSLGSRSDLFKIEAGSNRGHIYYKILKSGDPDQPSPFFTSGVDVYYKGATLNGFDTTNDSIITGKEFDTSYKDKYLTEEGYKPMHFGSLSGLIEGWWVALQEMKPGDKWQLYIPWTLGYGTSGSGNDIPGYSTLIFEVELVNVYLY